MCEHIDYPCCGCDPPMVEVDSSDICEGCNLPLWDCECELEYDESYEWDEDGQPDEYTEWQDVYGGDDWDHGQYDEY